MSFWPVATLFAVCLGLTAEILRLRSELAVIRSEAVNSTVETSRQKMEIADLRHKLAAKARTALASPGVAHSADRFSRRIGFRQESKRWLNVRCATR